MSKIIIHIGANKTASTTFQRALFSKSQHIHYLGEDGVGYSDYADALNSLINDDDLHYKNKECGNLFESHLKSSNEKTFVFSSEDVLTSPVPVACAKRLHGFMPNAEVLLVIRNQYTAIPSFYANHGAFLKPAPPSYFRRFVSLKDWILFQEMFQKYGAFASFKYNTLLSIYEELFGSNKIHVLLFEDFLSDKNRFVEKLAGILDLNSKEVFDALDGKHERKRYTKRMLAYNRFRTAFLWNLDFSKYLPFSELVSQKLSTFLEGGMAAKIDLTEELKEKLHTIYAAENTLIDKKYSLNLAKYGYPLLDTEESTVKQA